MISLFLIGIAYIVIPTIKRNTKNNVKDINNLEISIKMFSLAKRYAKLRPPVITNNIEIHIIKNIDHVSPSLEINLYGYINNNSVSFFLRTVNSSIVGINAAVPKKIIKPIVEKLTKVWATNSAELEFIF